MPNFVSAFLSGQKHDEYKQFSPIKKALVDAVLGYAQMNQLSMTDENPEYLPSRDPKTGKRDTRQDLGIDRLFQTVKLKLFRGENRQRRLVEEVWNAKSDTEVLNIAIKQLENSNSSRLKLYIAVFLSEHLPTFNIPSGFFNRVPAANPDEFFEKGSTFEFIELRNQMTSHRFYNHMNLGGFINMNSGAVSQLEENVLGAAKNWLKPPPSYEEATREDKTNAAEQAGFSSLPSRAVAKGMTDAEPSAPPLEQKGPRRNSRS